MQLFTVPQLPMEGPEDMVLRFPETWDVQVRNMTGYNRPAVGMEQIQDALKNPIGTAPLRELAKGKKEIVIIFDDYTRGMKWQTVAHAVSAELDAAGIEDKQIRFMCSLGSHGIAMRTTWVQKLGEGIVSRYRVYNHNAFTLENVHVGKTKTWDVDVYANPEVMACDLKIALGAVTPHPINGFGGGSKNILPGIVSYQTIVDHHVKSFKIAFDAMNEAAKTGELSKVGCGIYDKKDHPAIDVNDEAAEMVGLDFLVNVVSNGRGEAVGLWAGDFRQVFVEALTDGKENYATDPAVDKDIVVANAFYKVNEPMIAMLPVGPSLKPTGGTAVIITNMPEGLTTHYFQGDWGATAQGRPPHANAVNIPDVIDQIILYNEYPHPGASWWVEPKEKIVKVTKWDDVIALLQKKYPGKPSVALYPNADFQYLRSPDGKVARHEIHPPS